MSAGEVVLGLALVVVVGMLGVLILTGRGGSALKTGVKVGALAWSFELSQETRRDVDVQLVAAVEKTGLEASEDSARARLEAVQTVRAGKALWVDDHPDNNVEETLMLTGLGFAITQTTSTDAALRYLRQTPYELLITDLGRSGNPDAGLDLLAQLPPNCAGVPTIVYTMQPGERASRAIELGAAAVTETPGELLEAVLTRFAS